MSAAGAGVESQLDQLLEPGEDRTLKHGLTLRSKSAIVRYNTRTKGDSYSTATIRSVGSRYQGTRGMSRHRRSTCVQLL